jgi:hypothetical protein
MQASEAAMNDGIRELTADAIVQAGGWHPRYARVLLIEHDEQDAVILVDGNGDGAELELEYWHRGGEGLWHGGSSSGHGSLDSLQTASWNAGDFVAAVGRARPNTEVSIAYASQVYRRRPNEFGTWGFVHAADSPDASELPAVAIASPPTPGRSGG